MKFHRKPLFSATIGVLLALFILCPVFVFADPSSGGEGEMVGGISDVSTALTAYVNNVVGANGNDKHNNQRVENPGNAGNAGAYVGYGDESLGFTPFITSSTTSGSSASTYDAWVDILDGGDTNAAYAYVRFGKTLADAGLDETMSANTTKDFGRIAMGCISLVVFAASELVPTVFEYALGFLKIFNIFGLFSGTHVINWAAAFPTLNSVLQPLVNFFSDLYTKIFTLISKAAIVPLLLALMIASIFLLRKPAGTQVMNTMKKVVFIFVGVPLMASLYTGALDYLYDVTQEGSATARLAAASFVDFESWAENRLAIPTDVVIESSPKGTDGAVNAGGTASENMLLSLRESALNLNKANNEVLATTGWTMPGRLRSYYSTGGMWNNTSQGSDVSWSKTDASENVKAELFGMLTRYMMSEKYTPAAWATGIVGTWPESDMGSSDDDGSKTDTVRSMLNSTDSVDDWMNRTTEDNNRIWDETPSTELGWVSKGFNMFADGTLNTSGNAQEDVALRYNGKLSTLSMYNYLSTSFQDSSIITYSNSNSVSEHVKQAHMSVTSVGSGVLGIMFMVNFWVCAGVVALLGCYFAFSMTLKNLKTSFQLLASIPMSLLGLTKSIAQVIMYTLMMIAQIILGAFLYTFMADILVVLSTVVEGLASGSISIPGESESVTVSILSAIGVTGASATVMAVLLSELALVLLVGGLTWKYRRACVYAYDCGLTWMMRGVTLPGFEDVFETVWVRHERMTRPQTVGLTITEVFGYLRDDHGLMQKGGMVS